MRRVSGSFLIWTILLLGLMPVAYGQMYKWVDRQGKVHFTDNLSAIPPEYRDQVEERASVPPSHPPTPGTPGSAPVPQPSVEGPQTSTRYTVPLHREGNASLVDVVFNGTLKIRMIVDTGASLTLLPTSAAKQLALNLEEAPVIFIRGAVSSTTALMPLMKVKSITVGDATVQDVEVAVYDTPPIPAKASGLLGMTFLDEFQITMTPLQGT